MDDFKSRSYRNLLEAWAKPILDTLDSINSLSEDTSTAAGIDGLVAEILFDCDLVTVSGREMEAYGKTPEFSEFYARFKKTGIYRDMEEIRRVQTTSSA